jgi:hypothetical protein
MDDGNRWMRRLLPLRDELMQGDLRPLYLGWLAGASSGELRDSVREPEVPPGLATLSPGQRALVEFLDIDSDMLVAARRGSARVPRNASVSNANLDVWLETWSRDEMATALKRLARGDVQEVTRDVGSRYAAWARARRPKSTTPDPRRTVGQLRELARASATSRAARSRVVEKRGRE